MIESQLSSQGNEKINLKPGHAPSLASHSLQLPVALVELPGQAKGNLCQELNLQVSVMVCHLDTPVSEPMFVCGYPCFSTC